MKTNHQHDFHYMFGYKVDEDVAESVMTKIHSLRDEIKKSFMEGIDIADVDFDNRNHVINDTDLVKKGFWFESKAYEATK